MTIKIDKTEQLEELLAAKEKLDAEIEERQTHIRKTKAEKEAVELAERTKREAEQFLIAKEKQDLENMLTWSGLDIEGGGDKRLPYILGALMYYIGLPDKHFNDFKGFIALINRKIKK